MDWRRRWGSHENFLLTGFGGCEMGGVWAVRHINAPCESPVAKAQSASRMIRNPPLLTLRGVRLFRLRKGAGRDLLQTHAPKGWLAVARAGMDQHRKISPCQPSLFTGSNPVIRAKAAQGTALPSSQSVGSGVTPGIGVHG